MSHIHNPIIPALTGAISRGDLVQYLTPLHSQNAGDGFGVCQYIHGVTAASGPYNGGVYSPTQNRIYLIPLTQCNISQWHYINCDTGAIVAYTHGFGSSIASQSFSGGVYSPTQNRIYLVPYVGSTATNWYYINCNTGSVIAYAHGAAVVANAYLGGVYSPTQNRIYFAPYAQGYSSNQWHYVDCNTGAIVAYTAAVINSTYYGGCYSPTQNRIYFVPFGMAPSTSWHYINCDTGSPVAYVHGFSASIPANAYTGGVYSPTQNRIYFVPRVQSTNANWHYVNCDTGTIVAYAHGQTNVAAQAYAAGCYSPLSNRIYFTPIGQGGSANWHYVDCNTGQVVSYLNGVTTLATAYAGNCIYSPTQGRVYFAPYSQGPQASWHYVQEFSPIEVPPLLMANGLFNKF